MSAVEEYDRHDHREGYHGYDFTDDNFAQLTIINLVCSTISFVSSLITLITYVIIRLRHWKSTSRVSLRCVAISSVANIVASIVHLIIRHCGEADPACFAARPLVMLFRMLTVSFLVLIGVNLVLVFVIRVKKTDRLEYYYYPTAVIYSMASVMYPFYLSYHPCRIVTTYRSCWYCPANVTHTIDLSLLTLLMDCATRYHTYFEKDDCAEAAWLSYYCMMMSIIVIAFACSVAAVVKLIYGNHVFSRRMNDANTLNQINTRAVQRHNSATVFKVLIRCILYPLVPFMCNIWGFISHTVIVRKTVQLSFSMAVTNSVFSSLEGFFVACIFFSDPVVTVLFKQKCDTLISTYVDQYCTIDVPYDEDDLRRGVSSKKTTARRVPLPASMRQQPALSPEKSITALRSLSTRNDNETSADGIIAVDKNFAYIPYRHRRLSALFHWILSRCHSRNPTIIEPMELPTSDVDIPSSDEDFDADQDRITSDDEDAKSSNMDTLSTPSSPLPSSNPSSPNSPRTPEGSVDLLSPSTPSSHTSKL